MGDRDAGGKDLEFEERDRFIEVRFLGGFSVDRFNRQAEAASKACREKQKSRMLVDLSLLDAQLSTLERYELASHAVRVSAGLKVALVVAPAFLDPNKFGILVAQNRGLTVDAFTDRQKALEWLEAES
ncbi:MAG TPA: hypothetical protein VKW04_04045 [Planctomycetota bacterium]|nr:hypothetical protein [Planctomycetota bacterium]